MGSAHSTMIHSTFPLSAASYMGIDSLLSSGPCGLDVLESCLHLLAGLGGGNGQPALTEVRAGPAEGAGGPREIKGST